MRHNELTTIYNSHPNYTIECVTRRKLPKEELAMLSYPYPYETLSVYTCVNLDDLYIYLSMNDLSLNDIELCDIGHSDKRIIVEHIIK